MNEKKLFFGIVVLVVLHIVFVCGTSLRLESNQQSIERLGNELENARANELVLEQRIATAEQTITDSRSRVERLATITRESEKQFTDGRATIEGLRQSIKKAEEFYKNLEDELNCLRNELSDNDSDLEIK